MFKRTRKAIVSKIESHPVEFLAVVAVITTFAVTRQHYYMSPERFGIGVSTAALELVKNGGTVIYEHDGREFVLAMISID